MNYHFIGIGGCGMSGLAQVFHQHGHKVTGSDMETSDVIDQLGRRNIPVSIGHHLSAIPEDVDVVVASAAVPETNEELKFFRQKNTSVLKYAEALGQLSKELDTIAITGTHGKSTTSGWAAFSFKHSGKDPSYVIGADVAQLGGGSGAGHGSELIVEACEYDRSFLNLRPKLAAILNIEADHLDYYKNEEEIIQAFKEFASILDEDGYLIANAEDNNVLKATDGLKCDCEYFSVTGNAHWQALNLEFKDGYAYYDLTYNGEFLEKVKLGLPGRFNVANSLALAGLCYRRGIEPALISQCLENFVGVGRRMSYKGMGCGVTVLDDYAHHPTEIKVTLDAIRDAYKPKKLWCIFQPHQHSRTRFFLDDFAVSFGRADKVVLPDIYFVRDSQQSRKEVNAGQLADKINASGGSAEYIADFEDIINKLCNDAEPGDLIVTMGAGNIWKVADELIRKFGSDRKD